MSSVYGLTQDSKRSNGHPASSDLSLDFIEDPLHGRHNQLNWFWTPTPLSTLSRWTAERAALLAATRGPKR